MNTEPRIQKKKSLLAQFLFAIACLATLVALFYAEEDWRGWHTWNHFAQQCAAKGIALDIISVAPPAVPDDENFAMTPIVSTSWGYCVAHDGKTIPPEKRDPHFVTRMRMPNSGNPEPPKNIYGDRVRGVFTDLEGWQSYYRRLAAKTNEFAVPAQPQSPAGDVLLALGKYNGVIEELRAANRLPQSRYPLDYGSDSPWAVLLPYLAPLKISSQTLSLRSIAELQNGEPQKALEDIQLGLQLSDKVRNEPILISHLVRLAMVQLLLQPVWEGLAQHKWSDDQLAALEAALAQIDFIPGYGLSLHGELGGQTVEMTLLRRHPDRLDDIFNMANLDDRKEPIPHPGGIAVHFVPNGWFYQNEYRAARLVTDYYLPAADPDRHTFSPEIFHRGETILDAETKTPDRYNWYETLLVTALRKAAIKFAYGEASVDLARTAVALERYRLARGEFPETLDALVPKFIAAVPHDVIGGQPLKYRREADGRFVLYSVGWNETDDGGTIVLKENSERRAETPMSIDLEKGDWVWEYPAK
jgi:hypothetical protein